MAVPDARWWFVITIVTTSIKEVSTGLKARGGVAGRWKSTTMIFTTRSRIPSAAYAAADFFFTITLLKAARGSRITRCQFSEARIHGVGRGGGAAKILLDGEGQTGVAGGMLTKRKERAIRIRLGDM